MKYFILLLCLGVCYVSLPVTNRVVAEDQAAVEPAVAEPASGDAAAEAEKEPAASEAAADAADEQPKQGAADEAASGESSDAAKAADDKPEAAAKDDAAAAKAGEKKADAKPAEKEAKKERKTHKVAAKRLRVDVTLDGNFVAEKMHEVALRPEAWTQFEVVEVVEHGAEVHEGQVLVKFDDEKINREIDDLELSQHVSELAIRKAEEELPRQEKSLAMNAVEAERTDKNAREDYDRYHKIDRPMIVKSVEYSLKYAQFSLDYAQDELDQLEKMYEADDLTEETEEIILKRQRNQLDFAKFNLEQTKQHRDEVLDVRLPRADIRIEEALDRAALGLARARTALAVDLTRARYELEQQKESRAKSLDRHAKLLADRGLMQIKAPADGIVYYGECTDGEWSGLASMIAKLKPHNSVSADSVLMTIVARRPLRVLAKVGEDKRPDLAVGQPARIVPPKEDAERFDARIKTVSAVPVGGNKFHVDVDLTGSELPEWLVAGMSCKVKVTVYDKADALVVPKKAVQTDEDDDELKYVWLVDPEDDAAKAERRDVKLGKTSGDDVEVLNGLREGDVISLEDESKKAEPNQDKD